MDLFEHGAPQNSMVLSMIFSFLHCPEKKKTHGACFMCCIFPTFAQEVITSSQIISNHPVQVPFILGQNPGIVPVLLFFFSRVNVHMWNPPWFPLGTSPLGLCNTPVHDGNDEDDEFEMTSWMSSPKTPVLARLAKVGCHVLMFIEAT